MGKCSFIRSNEMRSLSTDHMLLWTEICGIQKAILQAAANGQLETIVSDGTPMTWVSGIASITVTNGGAGYDPVVATANVVHPSGIDAAITPIITGGTISGFVIDNGGSGYGPLAATTDLSGSGNSDADLEPIVDPTVNNGTIVGFNILDTGTGYQVGDPIIGVRPAGNTGINLQAVVSSVGSGGEITGYTIINGGTGYATVMATVEIDHPTGTGFLGVVQTTAGVVTGVSIQNGGNGYQDLYPTAIVVDTPGTGAVLEIGEDNVVGGVIQTIDVAQAGFGYSQSPTVEIYPAPTSAGDNATAIANVTPDPNNYGPISPEYYAVLNGQSSDRVKTAQIEFVKDYFTAIGYNIRPQVNPLTGNTLQWWILW